MAVNCCLTGGQEAGAARQSRLNITVLGSGSAGNAMLVRSGTTAFLLDAGLSAKRLAAALAVAGVEPASLDGIVLTHEHSDHAGGLKTFCRRWEVPVYATRLTADALRFASGVEGINWRFFSSGQRFSVGDIPLRSFSVPHDAADPVGFVVGEEHARLGVLTDLGTFTRSVVDALRGVHALVVETNYDEELLDRDTKRPWSVKQRIAARHGHLSNRDAAALVREVASPVLHTVILSHLSEDCNEPQRACDAVRAALDFCGYSATHVICAPRSEPLPPIFI